MRLVCAVLLAMQLNRVGAVICGPGEYRKDAWCCPMCPAGRRVSKDCTDVSGTTCVQCDEDTYTDHPNGLKECRKCKLCDRGANLVAEQACTYTKNTVCGCQPGYFCSHFGTEDCELCQRHTTCFPGGLVRERGTKTADNVCEACPPGTFSTAEMPYNCTLPMPKENGVVGGEGRNLSIIIAIVFPLGVLLAVGLASIWKTMRKKRYMPAVQESGTGQQGQALMLTVENKDDTTVPVQETGRA